MAYRLEISRDAQRDLSKLNKETLIDIRKRLERLAEEADDIRHLGHSKEISPACTSCVSANIV